MGFDSVHLNKIKRKITTPFQNSTGKSLFLKGFYNDESVTVLESQSSAMLNTFATANGLIYMPYNKELVAENEEVTVIPIN
jgi:molybdopterin molybdotransferase